MLYVDQDKIEVMYSLALIILLFYFSVTIELGQYVDVYSIIGSLDLRAVLAAFNQW